MRLVCPNCDAEYEVEDAAIPRMGRDVQCSNCGHAWYQPHPEVVAEQAEEDALFGVATDDAAPEPEDVLNGVPDHAGQVTPDMADAPDVAAPAPVDVPDFDSMPDVDGMADVTDAPTAQPEPAAAVDPVAEAEQPATRNIDDSVLAVLREEAARESNARRAEAPPPALETQTEMRLDPAADAAARRVARLKGEPEPAPQPAPEVVRSRRDLFPAIEEINSTLRSSSGRAEADEGDIMPPQDGARPARGGFGRGFLTLVLLALIIVALYVFAPLIGAKVPALAGVAAGYVAFIDAARLWLDTEIHALIGTLRGFEGGAQG